MKVKLRTVFASEKQQNWSITYEVISNRVLEKETKWPQKTQFFFLIWTKSKVSISTYFGPIDNEFDNILSIRQVFSVKKSKLTEYIDIAYSDLVLIITLITSRIHTSESCLSELIFQISEICF